MKKTVILTAISLLTLLAPLPGSGAGAPTERAAALPDIWVFRGYYSFFESGRASLGGSDPEELRVAFLKETGSLRDARRIDAKHPLAGRIDACDIFILDGTELYFKDTELPSGGLYGFSDVNIMSGSLDAAAVFAAGGLFVAPASALRAGGEINTGGTVECFGGEITAGGINCGGVWFDSSESPLSVAVSGSVFTGLYTQSGGSVEIGGGLHCQLTGVRYSGALITVNGEYARYGATYLSVCGDVTAFGDYGGVEVGGGSGGYDEAALRAFESERSEHKGAWRGAYEASPPAVDVTFIIGGELRVLAPPAARETFS